MVHRALAEREIGEEVALPVHLEQVPDTLAGIAVVAVHRLREALGRDLDLDGGDEEGQLGNPRHSAALKQGESGGERGVVTRPDRGRAYEVERHGAGEQ